LASASPAFSARSRGRARSYPRRAHGGRGGRPGKLKVKRSGDGRPGHVAAVSRARAGRTFRGHCTRRRGVKSEGLDVGSVCHVTVQWHDRTTCDCPSRVAGPGEAVSKRPKTMILEVCPVKLGAGIPTLASRAASGCRWPCAKRLETGMRTYWATRRAEQQNHTQATNRAQKLSRAAQASKTRKRVPGGQ
jgi:hypothetical protein